MTIYEIKRLTSETSPYFFERKTLEFFGQRMSDYRVYKQKDGRYLITAPIRNQTTKKVIGHTERMFNPKTNKLERL